MVPWCTQVTPCRTELEFKWVTSREYPVRRTLDSFSLVSLLFLVSLSYVIP